MNSILRAQQRDSAWPFEVYDCETSTIPSTSIPKSPDHRIRRSRSSSAQHHAIDIIPTFENPCRPCRASPRPSKSSSSCFHKFRAISPYLSMACFIAILVWEICSLHSEVYKLRYAENVRRLGTPSNAATYLRRINEHDDDGGGGAASRKIRKSHRGRNEYYNVNEHQEDIRRTEEEYQTVISTPLPPSHLSPSSSFLDGLNEEGGDEEEEEEIINRNDRDDESDHNQYGSKSNNNIDNHENRIDIEENTRKPRRTKMEEQLAELMATRELLKYERRKRPDSNSVPLSKIT